MEVRGERTTPALNPRQHTAVCEQEGARGRLKKGSINQRIGFRLGSGWIHHSSHLELWTLGIGQSDTRVEDVVGGINYRSTT